MSNEPLVSVIVPVYNVEPYLCACLDSVLAQEHKNLDIILVDDGSTDRSGQICDEYAQRDGRIRVIHKDNGGSSDARNAGLDEMRGDFVCFIDADDILAPTFVSEMLCALKSHKTDLSVCAFGSLKENEPVDRALSGKAVHLGNREELLVHVVQNLLKVWSSSCNKMYPARVFNGLRFETGARNEDVLLLPKVLRRVESACYLDKSLYYYRIRPGSNSHFHDYRYYSDVVAKRELYQLVSEVDNKKLSEQAYQRYYETLIGFIDRMQVHKDLINTQKRQSAIHQAVTDRQILKNPFVPLRYKALVLLSLLSTRLAAKALLGMLFFRKLRKKLFRR